MGIISPLRAFTSEVDPMAKTSVLFVDDEDRIRSNYRKLLTHPGREIFESATGQDAIHQMETLDIDVVVLDLGLPDMTGLEIMEWISRNAISASVVVFTAEHSIDLAIKTLRLGAYAFIRKSGEPEELINAVDNAFNHRRLRRMHALMTGQIERSERLHRFLVENSPDIIYTLDERGCFAFVNGRVETLLGYHREELIGKHYSTIIYEDDQDRARYAFNERRTDSRASSNVEIRLKHKNAGYLHFDNRLVVAIVSALGIYEKPDEDAAHRFTGTYGVARDITERKRAEDIISHQAFHDQLTGLPNRTLFKDRLTLAIAQAARNGKKLVVMFADLDRFKLINDTYGHAEGDELLKAFGQRVRACLRAGDTLARLGGDEFILVLTDLSSYDDAQMVAEKILQSLEPPFTVGGKDFRATSSFGLALYPDDGDSVEALVQYADIAMYQVKLRGKNGYQRYMPEMRANYDKKIRVENDLRTALSCSQFELHFQPQVSLTKGCIVGVEALLRWRHPDHGLLNPGHFIAIAEETGLIGGISDWVIHESFSQLARWIESGIGKHLRMSLNLSAQDFFRGRLAERIIDAMNALRLPAHCIDIEITESLLMQDAEKVISTVRQIRAHGIRVSIDDFGTRYSSLNYLRRFSVSGLKIDQSFVRDLENDHGSHSIIHAVMGIARGFGLHVLAEGVENEQQLRLLHMLGCDEMQGFLFSHPCPADETSLLLRNGLPMLKAYRNRLLMPGMDSSRLN